MPKSAKYTISWVSDLERYLLTEVEMDQSQQISDKDASWLEWLENHRAFAFNGRNGQLNLLKEKRQRGREGYWYAYHRRSGGMTKRYLGLSMQLSLEKLEEISQLLQEDQKTANPPQDVEQFKTPDPVANFVQFEPLLMPKLQLPRLPKMLLPRERLWKLLDKGHLEHKLTVISAPAGYGKTTTAGQWIADRRNQSEFPGIAFVTLDEGDNDPIRFWRYIIAACQKLYPEFGKETLELLSVHRLPPFKPLELMLTALLNELSQLEQATILILDDFHLIRSVQIATQLGFFFDHLPHNFHVVILVRGDPSLALARLRAYDELLEIYPPQLAFSQEEIRAFFEQAFSFTLSPSLGHRIFERLAGWPAGLRLLVRDMHSTDRLQDLERMLATFTGSHWSIQGYFLSEVLQTLPFDQQEFLLQTSVFPRITASLCDAVLEREDSAARIMALQGGDLFLIPLDTIGEWSKYHPLFAEAMQQEARQRLGEDLIGRLSERASRWYEEHALFLEATEAALNAQDYLRAAHLMERMSESGSQDEALTMPDLYRFSRWMERLPNEVLERYPDLCVQYAMGLLFISMEGLRTPENEARIQQLLQMAEQKWRDANNTVRLAEVFSFRALLARQDGKILQAVTWARQALAWLPQEDLRWRTLGLTVVGVGELLEGQVDRAVNLLLEALTLTERQGNFIYARAIRGMLCWATLEHGELQRTAEELRLVQAEARAQEDRDDIARTQLVLATIAYQRNRLDDAEQATREALAIGEQMEQEEFLVWSTILLAQVAYAQGDALEAQQLLTNRLHRGQTVSSPLSYQLYREVQLTLAGMQLASGDSTMVEHWLASIGQRNEVLPLLQRQREEVMRARLLLRQQQFADAITRLEGLNTATRLTGHRALGLEVQVLLALAYAQIERPEKSRMQLIEPLQLAHSEGYLRLFLDEGRDLIEIVRGSLSHFSDKTVLRGARFVLSAFDRESGLPALDTAPGEEQLLEPLSPQEQKVLRLLAAGNPNAEIARELVVSVNTVRSQVQSIYRKLDVTNRVEASSVARRLKLL